MAQSHILEHGDTYKALSDQAVDALHQKFMDKIHNNAQKLVPPDMAAREVTLALVVEVLLAHSRMAKKPPHDEICEKIAAGPWRFKRYVIGLRRQQAKDPWKKYRKAMDKAFAKREEALLSEKVFSDKDRLYFKLNNADMNDSLAHTRHSVASYLSDKGYAITNYLKGYATDAAGKQQFKIGKLLKDKPALLDMFKNDEARTSSAKYMVLSRNQVDLENMTSGRSWHSCLSPDIFPESVPPIVGSKTLIAYMISENDPEINNPLARILLKPYDCREDVEGIRDSSLWYDFKRVVLPSNHFDEEALCEDSVVFVPSMTYGLSSQLFKRAVQEFTDKNLNQPNEKDYQRYRYIYRDGGPQTVKADQGVIRDSMWPNP